MVIIVIIFMIIIYGFSIRFRYQVMKSDLIAQTFTPANLLRNCRLSIVHFQLNPMLGIRKNPFAVKFKCYTGCCVSVNAALGQSASSHYTDAPRHCIA